ncbi:cingulin-like [Branchiostoma floridae]|uniref:Cingulin-like n=1 Tax=Branchiostoma floridae TaxID=7739 RepID=A0A9J7M8K4_BRAFL|nr:cingulin-like [Branchiostoma floridae]
MSAIRRGRASGIGSSATLHNAEPDELKQRVQHLTNVVRAWREKYEISKTQLAGVLRELEEERERNMEISSELETVKDKQEKLVQKYEGEKKALQEEKDANESELQKKLQTQKEKVRGLQRSAHGLLSHLKDAVVEERKQRSELEQEKRLLEKEVRKMEESLEEKEKKIQEKEKKMEALHTEIEDKIQGIQSAVMDEKSAQTEEDMVPRSTNASTMSESHISPHRRWEIDMLKAQLEEVTYDKQLLCDDVEKIIFEKSRKVHEVELLREQLQGMEESLKKQSRHKKENAVATWGLMSKYSQAIQTCDLLEYREKVLRMDNAELTKELNVLRRALGDGSKMENHIQKEMYVNQVKDLERDLENLRSENDDLRAYKDILERRFLDKKELSEQLKENTRTMEKELERLRTECDEMRTEISTENQIQQQNVTRGDESISIESTEQKAMQIHILRKRVTVLDSELQTLRKKNDLAEIEMTYAANLDELRKEAETAKSSMELARKEAASHRSEKDALSMQVVMFRHRLNELHRELPVVRKERDSLRKSIVLLKANRQHDTKLMMRELFDLKIEMAKMLNEIDLHREDKATILKQLIDLQASLTKKARQDGISRSAVMETTRTVSKMMKHLQAVPNIPDDHDIELPASSHEVIDKAEDKYFDGGSQRTSPGGSPMFKKRSDTKEEVKSGDLPKLKPRIPKRPEAQRVGLTSSKSDTAAKQWGCSSMTPGGWEGKSASATGLEEATELLANRQRIQDTLNKTRMGYAPLRTTLNAFESPVESPSERQRTDSGITADESRGYRGQGVQASPGEVVWPYSGNAYSDYGDDGASWSSESIHFDTF